MSVRPGSPPAASERAIAIGFGPRFVVGVSLGSTLNPINSSMIAVALVSIGATFGVGADTTTWLVASLYLATAIGQPLMGRLADRLGARRIYLIGLLLTGLGGVVGWLAPTLAVLIVARVLLGLGTSAAYPAAIAMVRSQSQVLGRDAPGTVLGALAIAGQVTMAVGPPLGGLLIAVGGWPSIFLVNVPLAVVGAAAALAWLPRDRPAAAPASTPGLWRRVLLHDRALTTTYVRYAVTFVVTYGFIYGWTQWLEEVGGFSASVAGLLLMPSFVVAACSSALASRIGGVRGPLLVGAIALAAGCGGLLLLDARSPVWALVLVSMIFGFQNGLLVVANQAAMYAQAPPDHVGIAAGLLRTSMYIGAMLASLLIGIAYGPRASDPGLHTLAVVLTVLSALLVVHAAIHRPHRGDTAAEHRPA